MERRKSETEIGNRGGTDGETLVTEQEGAREKNVTLNRRHRGVTRLSANESARSPRRIENRASVVFRRQVTSRCDSSCTNIRFLAAVPSRGLRRRPAAASDALDLPSIVALPIGSFELILRLVDISQHVL